MLSLNEVTRKSRYLGFFVTQTCVCRRGVLTCQLQLGVCTQLLVDGFVRTDVIGVNVMHREHVTSVVGDDVVLVAAPQRLVASLEPVDAHARLRQLALERRLQTERRQRHVAQRLRERHSFHYKRKLWLMSTVDSSWS